MALTSSNDQLLSYQNASVTFTSQANLSFVNLVIQSGSPTNGILILPNQVYACGITFTAPAGSVQGVKTWTYCSGTNFNSIQIGGCRTPGYSNYNPLANVSLPCINSTLATGCTAPLASNYNPLATVDDGSCYFPVLGCTYTSATNYNPIATVYDGSCVFPTSAFPNCSTTNLINQCNSACLQGTSFSSTGFAPCQLCTDCIAPYDTLAYLLISTFISNFTAGAATSQGPIAAPCSVVSDTVCLFAVAFTIVYEIQIFLCIASVYFWSKLVTCRYDCFFFCPTLI